MRAGRGDDENDVFFSGGQREATARTSEYKRAEADSCGNALALLVDDALAPRPKILRQAKKTSPTMLCLELAAVHARLRAGCRRGTFGHETKVHSGTFGYIRVHSGPYMHRRLWART